MNGPAWLLDTNILLRIAQVADPHYSAIRTALASIKTRGERLCYTSQTLAEFWNVSTRPRDKNGRGLSIAKTELDAQQIEREFELLPDAPEVHEYWRRLIVEHAVKGAQVHDARLAAVMYVYGVQSILTLNARDFGRYRGLAAMHPAAVKAAGAE